MTDQAATASEPLRSAGVNTFCLLGAQLLLVGLLAPGDGGAWQSRVLPPLWACDALFCLASYFIARFRRDRRSGMSFPAALLFTAGSVAVTGAVTYAMSPFARY